MLRSKCVDRIMEAVESGSAGKTACVVASPELVKRIRGALVERTAGLAVFNVPVYGFDEFVMNLVEPWERGRSRITDVGREMLVRDVISRAAAGGSLKALGALTGKPGIVRSMCATIDELKQNGLGVAEFEAILNRWRTVRGKGPSARHQDLLAIYAAYQDSLTKLGLSDREDAYRFLLRILEDRGVEALKPFEDVWFEEFFDPTPIQASIMGRIVSLLPGTTVRLSYDRSRRELDEVISRAEKLAGLTMETHDPCSLHPPSPTQRLSLDLFAPSPSGFDTHGQIRVLTAPGAVRELREVARECKRLIVEQSISPSDICMVVSNPMASTPPLIAALNEFGVPCAAPLCLPLSTVPVIGDIMAFASSVRSRFDLARLLSSPFLGGDTSAGSRLRNGLGLRRASYRLHQWSARLRTLDVLGGESQGFHERLEQAMNLIPETHTPEGHGRALIMALEHLGLPNTIFLSSELETTALNWAAWTQFRSAVEDIAVASEAMGEEALPMSYSEFTGLLRSALEGRSVIRRAGAPGGVAIIAPSAMRGLMFRAVFITGLVEGEFPRKHRRDWMVSDQDRSELRLMGANIMAASDYAALDRFLFYSSVSAARDILYLSYPSSSSDGSAIRRSLFVDEVIRATDNSEFAMDCGSVSPEDHIPREWAGVSSERELGLRYFAIRAIGLDLECAQELVAVHSQGQHDLACAMERRHERARTAEFTEYDGFMVDPEIKATLSNTFHPSKTLSAGAIEAFLKCPFLFMCEQVLRLGAGDDVPDTVSPLERGRVYHELLRVGLDCRKGSELAPGWENAAIEAIEREAQGIMATVDLSRTEMEPEVWQVVSEIMVENAKAVIRAEAERLTGGPWKPAVLEWAFGTARMSEADPHSINQPLVISTEAGEVRVSGRVDRIDASLDGALAVYDYKTKGCPGPGEVESLAAVQVPLYVMAAQELLGALVAGGSYYSVEKASLESGVWRKDYADDLGVGKRRKCKLDNDEWDQYLDRLKHAVVDAVLAIRSGQYSVNPKNCPGHWCRFSTVCRFDEDVRAAKAGDGGGDIC